MIAKIAVGTGLIGAATAVMLVPFLLQGVLGWEWSLILYFACLPVAMLLVGLFEDYLDRKARTS